MTNLSAAGLTDTETKVYEILLKQKEVKPSELTNLAGESRTNMYKILDRLVQFGLAEKFDKEKIIHYKANNPARLLQLARAEREQRDRAERELEAAAESLSNEYIKSHEQPGVKFYQGEKEISQIFFNVAKAKSEVLFIHTDKGIDFYGFKTMHNLRMLAPKANVKRRALTPDVARGTVNYQESDPFVLLERTWLNNGEYTAPVEWGVYDNSLYIISYGTEALGITVESPQIAESFRQLFRLLETNQKLRPDYHKLPVLASKKGLVK